MVKLNDLLKDLLVTTYGAVLAVLIQELVDRQKKKTPKPPAKHFKRS